MLWLADLLIGARVKQTTFVRLSVSTLAAACVVLCVFVPARRPTLVKVKAEETGKGNIGIDFDVDGIDC